VARYFLQRLLTAIPTLLVIATLAFMLLHATPGGPFDSDRLLVPQIQHSIEARYHLDEPVWRQFLRYLHDLARGDLGPSFQYRNTSVNELIAQGLPVDLAIGGTAMLIALLTGGGAGLWAATRPGSMRDRATMGLAMIGISFL
jgi:oligopeptide transport system permease protein